MKIIIKFILKSIREKKFRTFLILFAIAVSAALFFASSAISGSIEKIYVSKLSNNYGNSDIIVFGEDKAPSKYFNINKLEEIKSEIEYGIGAISEAGLYKVNNEETMTFNLRGINYNDLQRMNPVNIISAKNLDAFEGKKIIISNSTSQKYKLAVGDSIELKINGGKYKFTVCGIAGPSSFFANDGQSVCGIVPLDTLSSLMEAKGRVSIVYIKVKDPSEKNNIIEKLKPMFKNYTVQQSINPEDLKQQMGSITTPFMMMTLVVLGMAIFITYTAFKVISIERLPMVGTFRSIGATKKMTDFILIAESITYGIIGGIIGAVLGIGVLYLMTFLTTPEWMRGNGVQVQFDFSQLLFSFLLAIAIALISAIVPIIRVSRLPVKEIVLNEVENEEESKIWKLILGLILIIVSFKLPDIVPKNLALYLDGLCMILSVVAVILLVPYITGVFVKVFEKVYIFFLGNEGVLAAKNLRENKSILNNISLLAIGISALLMINTCSYSVGVEVLDAYSKFNADIFTWGNMLDKNTENLIKNVAGVSDTYPIYSSSVKIADSDRTIDSVEGVSSNKYFQYYSEKISNSTVLFKELDEDRNIILSDIMLSRTGLKVGDNITLEMGKKKRTYKIIGSINTINYNGSYALVGEKYLKNDLGIRYYSTIYVKTNKDPQIVQKNIQKQLQRLRISSMTKVDMQEENMKSNEQLFNILNAFSVMALIIGIFGVLNNLLISFMQRKRSLAIFRSIGMSKAQAVKMLFIEAFSGGIVGGTVGVFAGTLMIYIVPKVSAAMELPLEMNYSWSLFLYSFIGGIIITVVASIVPNFKSSKLNIIEAIKYE